MKGIEAVLFDAGGTLIHVDGERVCGAAQIPYAPEGFADAEAAATGVIREWILRHPHSTDAERFPLFLDELLRRLGIAHPEERDAAARRITGEHRRANLWSGAALGARETLETLRARGYRLGVVSNADGRVQELLEDVRLLSLLDVIVDSARLGIEKPDPRIFLAATEQLGLPAPCCAYVGDLYEIDVVGARAAGLHPILIGRCPSPEPVERIQNLAELLLLFRAAPSAEKPRLSPEHAGNRRRAP